MPKPPRGGSHASVQDQDAGSAALGVNDFIIELIIGVGGSLIAGLILDGCDDDDDDRFGPDGDFDNDGIPNRYDSDDDNDGTRDWNDPAPFDPSAKNTPCPPPGACMSTVVTSDVALNNSAAQIVNQAYVDLTEATGLVSVETEASMGMMFSFPGAH